MPSIASSNPPEFQQYVAAFQSIDNLKDHHLQILQIHYQVHEKTITAKQLAQAMGYNHHTTTNMMYGRLARLVGERLGYNPEPEKLVTLVTFEKRKGEWHWILRSEGNYSARLPLREASYTLFRYAASFKPFPWSSIGPHPFLVCRRL